MGNVVRYTLVISLLILTQFLYSQHRIAGNLIVEDSVSTNSLRGVMVQLLNDNKILKTTFADAQGNFFFEQIPNGEYQVSINDLDYESEKIHLSIQKNSNSEIKIDIPIAYRSVELNEIFITRQKIKEKGDTIVFDAKLFAKGNEKVVEDLLKNIPGIKVEENGTIKINGKEIEKVMIEGDDFFEKGYKMVTQNMPSRAIDKVEVLQNYSHNPLMKGFENSDKVALNLTLEEGAKNQWFGDLSTLNAVFPEGNYDLDANMMSFGKKNKHYFLTNFNDLGKNSIGDVSQLYRTDQSQIGDELQNKIYLKNESSIFGINENKYRFNNQKMFSVNSIYNLSDKVKFKPRITTKWDKIKFNHNEFSQFYTPTDTITNLNFSHLNTKTFEFNTALDWNFKFNEQTMLDLSTNFTWMDWNQRNDQLFDLNKIETKLPIHSKVFNQKINFTHQINSKNVLQFNTRIIHQNNQEDFSLNAQNDLFPNYFYPIETKKISQNIDRNLTYLGSNFKWIYKTQKEHLWENEVNYQQLRNKLKSQFMTGNNLDYTPNDFQNQGILSQKEAQISSKYTFLISSNLQWISKLGLNYSQLDFENFTNSNSKNFLNPTFRTLLNWKFLDKNNLRFTFQFDNDKIDYSKFHSQNIFSTPNRFEKALSQPTILPYKNVSLRYDYGRFMDSFNLGFETGFRWIDKYISQKNYIENELQFQQLIIENDKKEWMSQFYINQVFDKLYHFIKLTAIHHYTESENYLNSAESRKIKQNFSSLELTINSLIPKANFNYSILGKWSHSEFEVENQTTSQDFYTLGLVFRQFIQKKYWFQVQNSLYYFPEIQPKSTYVFSDAQFSFDWEKYNLGITLKVNNIANTKTFSNQYISDFGKFESSYQLFPRMFLVGFGFKL